MRLSAEILTQQLEDARIALVETNARHQYDRRDFSMFPNFSGVYAIYRNEALVYIGETADIKCRMNDLKNTYNHTFRKKLGKQLFPDAEIIGRKYAPEVELTLNEVFQNEITISYLEVNYGRSEIEKYLISRNENLLNGISRRGSNH